MLQPLVKKPSEVLFVKDLTLLNHLMMSTDVSWPWEGWEQPEKLGYSTLAEAQCPHQRALLALGGPIMLPSSP